MKVPIFTAKLIDGSYTIKGFYFEMPKTTLCPIDPIGKVEKKHFIASYEQGDWGLPNIPKCYEIDISTLKKVDEICL